MVRKGKISCHQLLGDPLKSTAPGLPGIHHARGLDGHFQLLFLTVLQLVLDLPAHQSFQTDHMRDSQAALIARIPPYSAGIRRDCAPVPSENAISGLTIHKEMINSIGELEIGSRCENSR
jgi:hypothetical protein